MSAIQQRAKAELARLGAEIDSKFPGLRRRAKLVMRTKANRPPAVLGCDDAGRAVAPSLTAFTAHAHVLGTTRSGKTYFLDHLFRQFVSGDTAVVVYDPHGNHENSLFRRSLWFCHQRGLIGKRVIHVVDPSVSTHLTGVNPLALPTGYDPTVVADRNGKGIERVWGEENTDEKPTLQRVLIAVLSALCELGLTYAEAGYFLDIEDRYGLRSWAIANLKNPETRHQIEFLHAMNWRDLRLEITGPHNRLVKLTRTKALQCMLGQHTKCIDFKQVLDGREILLANLAGGGQASAESCQSLGRVVLQSLFLHGKERKHKDRPCFLLLDEAHLYLSRDVEYMLTEMGKYGVFVIAAHQDPYQLELSDERIAKAIDSCTNIKVAFRINSAEQAQEIGKAMFRATGQRPLEASRRPTVVGVEIAHLTGRAVARNSSTTLNESEGFGEHADDIEAESIGFSESTAEVDSVSQSNVASNSDSTNSSVGPGLFPLQRVVGATAGTSAASGNSTSQSSMSSQTHSYAKSRGTVRGASRSTSKGKADSSGRTDTESRQETFKPVYRNLPASFFSPESELLLASQQLAELPTGVAFYRYSDVTGLRHGRLHVPKLDTATPPAEQFDKVLFDVLELSPSAKRREDAETELGNRQRELIAASQLLTLEREEYRTKRARPAVIEAAKALPKPVRKSTRTRTVSKKKPAADLK